MLAVILTIVLLSGYAGALWWLLRRERAVVLLSVLALCLCSLSLRLVYLGDYPAGLNEDEAKLLHCSYAALQHGTLFRESCIHAPVLTSALFWAQLVPIVGPNRWAIRTYSLASSVLATATIFAVARTLGMSVAPSLATGAFIAVLPWSLFFGRISVGALTFNQLLLLAGVAGLLWGTVDRRGAWTPGGWPEVAVASLGLSLLLYDYFGGRVMIGMPILAALLTHGRTRWLCGAILLGALLAWLPYQLTRPPHGLVGFSAFGLDERLGAQFFETLSAKSVAVLQALTAPTGMDQWRTIRAAAMHPPLILALALVGLLSAGRLRALFLAAGFVGGLAPAVLSWGVQASAKRMLMAFPFIALAAGYSLHAAGRHLPQRWRWLVVVCVTGMIAFSSVQLYFSPQFWPVESRWTFDWERTEVVSALPPAPHPRFIVDRNLGYFFLPRTLVDNNFEYLTADNWFPKDMQQAIYAFDWHADLLRPFYENLFGVRRVQSFGRAFLVRLEARDWSWLREHGWTYEARCQKRTWRGQVPTLFHATWTFERMLCKDPVTHTWRGRWNGPAAHLRLRFSGNTTVHTSTDGRVVQKDGREQSAEFDVQPDTVITVTNTTPRLLDMALVEVSGGVEHIPAHDRVSPVASP